MLDVKYVIGEDWEGIYIQGLLRDEGHKIRFKDGFAFVCDYINQIGNVDHIEFSTYSIEQEWLENEGSLPEYFSDIPCDVIEKDE